jgi:hypothetical protein
VWLRCVCGVVLIGASYLHNFRTEAKYCSVNARNRGRMYGIMYKHAKASHDGCERFRIDNLF